MLSIFEIIACQDLNPMLETKIEYLIVEEKDAGSALKSVASALKEIQGSLSSLPKTQALLGKSVERLASVIPSLEGGDEDAKSEAQALFLLAAQFGSAFSRFLKSTIDVLDLKDPDPSTTVVDALGGKRSVSSNIEKFMIPSLSAIDKADKALEKLFKPIGQSIGQSSKSLKTAIFGKRATSESKFSVDQEINEGIFGDIAGKLSGFIRSLAKPPKDSKTTISNLEKLFGSNIAKAIFDDLVSEDMTVEKLKSAIESLKPSLSKISSDKVSSTSKSKKDTSDISKKAMEDIASKVKEIPEVEKDTKKAIDLAASGDAAWKEAYANLEKNQKEFFDKILLSLKSKKEYDPSEIDSVIKSAKSELASEYESELDILDDILTSRQIKQIMKIAGPKSPKFIDSKLAGDEELRKALQLAGRKRRGYSLNERQPMSLKNLLYEKSPEISQDIIDKLMSGGEDLNLDSEKSKKIADILSSAGQEKKRIKNLEAQLDDLKTINSVLKSENSEEIKKSKEYNETLESMLGSIAKSKQEAESLLKDKEKYEIKIKELEEKNSEQAKSLAKSIEDLAQKAEEISGIEAELQVKSDSEQNLPTLSSTLLTGDKVKGYKLKPPEELDAQANSLIRNLSNISGADGSWERFSKSQKSSNKKDLFDKLKSLKQDLNKLKIESKKENEDLIIERWQKLAGIEE